MRFRLEAAAVKPGERKRNPMDIDRIKKAKASRIESLVTKVSASAKKAASSNGIQVQIGAWKSSSSSNKQKSYSINSHSVVTKIKSELCPVTETHTAGTMPTATQASVATPTTPKQHRVKAEKTVSLSTAGGALNSATTPTSAKTMPITPTLARIKRDISHAPSPHSELSLISPDMQRVKVEIGHSPFNFRAAEMPRLPTSPVPHPLDVRDGGHFISPRKRSMLRDFENGSPSLKRHRLSTDSRGSSSEGGGANSPASSFAGGVAASPPRHNNGGGRVSSFSIDSIMSSSSSGNGTLVHRPVPIPASPAPHVRSTPSKSPARSLSPPPQTPHTPLNVPITPYQSRNLPATPLHPGLAHLAGVAANPSLGLTPSQTLSPAMAAVMMNSYYYNLAANAQYQHILSSAMGVTPTTPSLTSAPTIPSSNGGSRSSVSRQSSGNNVNSPPPTAATPTRPFSPWSLQYRGEPKVATPTVKPSELRPKLPSESGGKLHSILIIKSPAHPLYVFLST